MEKGKHFLRVVNIKSFECFLTESAQWKINDITFSFVVLSLAGRVKQFFFPVWSVVACRRWQSSEIFAKLISMCLSMQCADFTVSALVSHPINRNSSIILCDTKSMTDERTEERRQKERKKEKTFSLQS